MGVEGVGNGEGGRLCCGSCSFGRGGGAPESELLCRLQEPPLPQPHTPPLLAAPSCCSLGAIVCLPVQAFGPPWTPQTPDLSWDRKGMGVALCGDASWSPVAHPGNSRNHLRHGNTKLGGAPGAPTVGDTGWARPGGWVHNRRMGPYPQFLSGLFLPFGKTYFPGSSAWTLVSEPTSCWVWSREGLVGPLTGSGGWG